MQKKICKIDGCERIVNGRGLCSRHYYRLRFYGDPLAEGPGSGMVKGVRRATPDRRAILPTMKPTAQEIAWAAGIYEGEGTICNVRVTVYQREPWILERLQEFFGGKITENRRTRHDFAWNISGTYGRAFLRVIWMWLSPRRKAQINKWDWGKPPWTRGELPKK